MSYPTSSEFLANWYKWNGAGNTPEESELLGIDPYGHVIVYSSKSRTKDAGDLSSFSELTERERHTIEMQMRWLWKEKNEGDEISSEFEEYKESVAGADEALQEIKSLMQAGSRPYVELALEKAEQHCEGDYFAMQAIQQFRSLVRL